MTHEPLSDAALVALLAERVMGLRIGPMGPMMDSDTVSRLFDPFNDDRDFVALLDKCAERGWEPDLVWSANGWEAVLYLADGDWKAAKDPSRRRALVLAAAAAVRAEGETP